MSTRTLKPRFRNIDECDIHAPHPLRPYIGPIGAVLLTAIAYANSLGNGFTYDDPAIILTNPAVVEEVNGQSVPWYEPWRRPYWPGSTVRPDRDALYRPLVVQTFAWDMRLLGPAGWWFHLVNVTLHALVCVGVWWLARRLAGSAAIGVAAAWIFAVHPIHTEVVANLVGRAELLAAVGVVGACCFVDRLMLARRRASIVAWGVAAVLAGAVAIWSKESAVAVIPTAVAWVWWLRRHDRQVAIRMTRGVIVGLLMLAVFAGYLTARYHVCGNRLWLAGQQAGAGNVLHETDGLPRVLTPVSLVGRYAALTLWPARLLADYSYAVVAPTQSPLEGYFLLGLATLAVLLAAAVGSWRGDGNALVAWVGLVSSYFLVSNSAILVAVMMAERWWYLPSLWFLVLLLLGGRWLLARWAGPERLAQWAKGDPARALLVVVVAAMCVRTWLRNPDWRDSATLFMHDVQSTAPGHRSAIMLSWHAENLLAEGRLKEAETYAQEAVETYPESSLVQRVLALVLFNRGRPAEALAVLEEAQRIAPNDQRVAALLDQVRMANEGVDLQASLQRARARLAEAPDDVEAHYAAGYFLERLGAFAEAVDHYARAANLDDQRQDAWLGWARVLAMMDRAAESVDVYEQVLRRWPDCWPAHANLAVQLMHPLRGELYQPQRAVEHAEQALALAPVEQHLQMKVNLAEVNANCGRYAEAIRLYEAVIEQLDPADPQRSRFGERVEFLRAQP
ncbi:MAG: tetratricopeptide repeat protein [Phycisphaerae bacterium]|nr:tetratricopeptide repeat protein [Phycisphaerae bacterium]